MVPIKNSYTLDIVEYTHINDKNEQTDFGNGWGFYIDIENFKSALPKKYEKNRKKYKFTLSKNYNELVDEYYINLTKDTVDENNQNDEKKFMLNISCNIIIILIITYTILTIS